MPDKTPRERIAEILGWTPDYFECIKDLEGGCLCHREMVSDTCNRRLDEIVAIVEEARREGADEAYMNARQL